MLQIALCLISSLTPPQLNIKPCAVFFYGRYSQSEVAFQREVAERFSLELDDFARQNLQRPDFYTYDVPKGFERREGISYFLLPGESKLTVLRFVPLPNRKAFEQLVEHTSNMLGKDTAITGDESRKVLTPINGNREYLRYDARGIGVIGWSKDLFRINLKPLIDAQQRLAGKHSLFTINLEVIPRTKRLAVLQQIRDQQSTSLQQRDDESTRAYTNRRLVGESWLKFVDLLMTEVTEATWWLSLPEGRKPMRVGVTVRYVEDGTLDKSIRRMRGSRNLIQVVPDHATTAARFAANFSLNETTENLVAAAGNSIPTAWKQLFEQLLTDTNIEVHAALTDIGAGEPVLLLCAPRIGGVTSGRLPSLNVPFVGELVPAIRSATVGPEDVTFLQFARNALGDVEVPVEALFRPNDGKTRQRAFLRTELNLSAWASPQDPSGTLTLLQGLEKAHDKWQHSKLMKSLGGSMPARMAARMFPFKRTLDEADFKSLVDEIENNEHWNAEAHIGSRANTVFAEATVGADLYRWWVAREILSGIRIRKKTPDGP